MKCANDVRNIFGYPSLCVLLALCMEDMLCASALTLIRLDMAADIIRMYRALSINSPGELD